MAKRGRKPARRAAPKRTGTLGGTWLGFRPPEDLDDEAEKEFARIRAVLVKLGVAERTDPRLVVAAARCHSLIERAHKDVVLEGMTLSAANGTAMPHPMLAVINSQTMRLRGLLNDMGLTPASSKLTAPAAEGKAKKDPWAGLLVVG